MAKQKKEWGDEAMEKLMGFEQKAITKYAPIVGEKVGKGMIRAGGFLWKKVKGKPKEPPKPATPTTLGKSIGKKPEYKVAPVYSKRMKSPTELPIYKIKDKGFYFLDKRLGEYRNINNPHDRISFNDVTLKDLEKSNKNLEELEREYPSLYSKRETYSEKHKKTISVPKGTYMYLGDDVKDVGKVGYSNISEIKGTAEQIADDVKKGVLDLRGANGRLMRLRLIVGQTKTEELAETSAKLDALHEINKTRIKLGFEPVDLPKLPQRPTPKQLKAWKENIKKAQAEWHSMSPIARDKAREGGEYEKVEKEPKYIKKVIRNRQKHTIKQFSSGKGKGWFKEPVRHSIAAKKGHKR